MKINYKNMAIGAALLFVPLKSERAVVSHVQKTKKIISTESIIKSLEQDNKKTIDFVNRPIDKIKKMDSLFMMNFPKVSQPSRNLDVSKTRYKGSHKFLDIFLTGGVMEGKGKNFCEAQEKHGINAAFLVSIANHESWYGKSDYAIKRNNIAGMRNSNGYMTFDSVDECIDKMAENLKNNYIKKGLTTISQINKKYAESNEWGDAIIKHMDPLYNASKNMVYDFR